MDAFGLIDILIVVAYLVGITVLGILFSRRSTETSDSYFMAGRSLRWPTIGLALFATNISTVHLIGLASSGFGDGMVVGNFEWLAAFCLILLGLVFAPFYFRSKISTLPEFLEHRFGPGSRTMLAVMAVAGALFIHIGVSLYAGAAVINEFISLESPQWYAPFASVAPFHVVVSILIISLLTTLYTVLGGLKAVVVTESIQTVLLLVGALAVTLFGLVALSQQGINSLDEIRQAAKPDQMSMIRSDGDYPWYAMLLGYPVLGVWYWCSDQTIVQRVLGAKTERDAQIGPIFAGFLKILPVFLMVFPGVIAYILFRDEINARAAGADSTLVVLILELLPTGLKGLVVAGLLAALMSTVAGALNSTSTLVCIDIVKRAKPNMDDHRLVRIGQITAAVVMVLAMAWSTQGARFGGIFEGINRMISVLAPPISTVFLWGILWKRGTAAASLATLSIGFMLGAIVFVVDFPAVSGLLFGNDADGDPIQLVSGALGIPFMMQAWWLFVICSIIFVAVSLATPPPPVEVTQRYCYVSGSVKWGLPHNLSLGLVAVMVVLYVLFR